MNEELKALGYYEIVGVIFAIISVILAIKEKRLCWIATIISCLAYIPTFYSAKLYTEVILQGFFIIISYIGWRNWRIEGKVKSIKISCLAFRRHLEICLSCFLVILVLGTILQLYTNASFPYVDSAITVFSITTSVLQTKKILESWVYWILIDTCAIFIYINKALVLTAGLYALYLVLALLGFIEWRKTLLKENESPNLFERGTDSERVVS